MKLYAEAERIVRNEAPWVPTYVSRTFDVWQRYVRGYTPHPILGPRFVEVWLDDASPAPLAAIIAPTHGTMLGRRAR
jgi:hypothetical protein